MLNYSHQWKPMWNCIYFTLKQFLLLSLWGKVFLGGELQIDARNSKILEFLESAFYMKYRKRSLYEIWEYADGEMKDTSSFYSAPFLHDYSTFSSKQHAWKRNKNVAVRIPLILVNTFWLIHSSKRIILLTWNFCGNPITDRHFSVNLYLGGKMYHHSDMSGGS